MWQRKNEKEPRNQTKPKKEQEETNIKIKTKQLQPIQGGKY